MKLCPVCSNPELIPVCSGLTTTFLCEDCGYRGTFLREVQIDPDFILRCVSLQRILRRKVKVEPLSFKNVAALDVSYHGEKARGVGVTSSAQIVSVETRVEMPYLPGLFFLRELPVLLELYSKLKHCDLFLINGHGLCHPRLGIASHFGVVTGKASVGIAKRSAFCHSNFFEYRGFYFSPGNRCRLQDIRKHADFFLSLMKKAHSASRSFSP